MIDFYVVYTAFGFATYNETSMGLDYCSDINDAATFSTAREAYRIAQSLKGAVCSCVDGSKITFNFLTIPEVKSHIIDEENCR